MPGITRRAHSASIRSMVAPVSAVLCAPCVPLAVTLGAVVAGLTLIHFSAHREHFSGERQHF